MLCRPVERMTSNEVALGKLKEKANTFKKKVRRVFGLHCQSGLYKLEFHLFEHIKEDLKPFRTLFVLDASMYAQASRKGGKEGRKDVENGRKKEKRKKKKNARSSCAVIANRKTTKGCYNCLNILRNAVQRINITACSQFLGIFPNFNYQTD